MKILRILVFVLLLPLTSPASDTEIINGVEGDMDGTGVHMVFLSLVTEHTDEQGHVIEQHRSCSGSLISDSIILTASHCFGMNAKEISEIDYVQIYFTLNKNKSLGTIYKTKKFITHTDFNTLNGYLNNDIALISFSDPLPKGYRPADYQKTDDTFLLGKDFRTAGYGLQKDHSASSAIVPTPGSGYFGKLMSTKLKFDDTFPDKATFPTHISATQTTTGICSGDSGGAAFIRNESQQFKIVGINSSTGTEKSCLDGKSYYIRVALFSDWIAKTMEELK